MSGIVLPPKRFLNFRRISGLETYSRSQTTDLVEKLRTQNIAFEERIMPYEIHDLLRWSDWVRAYRATAEFFDRKLAASGKPK
jgi:hypothetical protein